MGPAASSIGREEAPRPPFEFPGRLEAFASQARDLAELFRALYYETARVMDATVFLFAVYDEAAKTVQVVRQMDRGVEHPGGSFPLGSGFTSEVIRSAAPRLIRHWATDGPPVRILYGTESEQLVAPQSAVVVPSSRATGCWAYFRRRATSPRPSAPPIWSRWARSRRRRPAPSAASAPPSSARSSTSGARCSSRRSSPR